MKFQRLIALGLVIASLLAVFAACDTGETPEQPSGGEQNNETDELVPSTVEKNNYGEDFFLQVCAFQAVLS